MTLLPALVAAEVARVEVTSRRDVLGGRAFGTAGGYELIVGRVHFVVDPESPRNKVVVDLDKAPRNAAGLVELSADLSILKPKDATHGNGVALIDIVNRGRRTVLTGFNRATASGDLTTEADFGDGLLMRQGFTHRVGRLGVRRAEARRRDQDRRAAGDRRDRYRPRVLHA